MSKYKAVFHMHGFVKELEMSGEPAIDVGFPMPAATSTEPRKTVSLYFKLLAFDGEVAQYNFYGSREMR